MLMSVISWYFMPCIKMAPTKSTKSNKASRSSGRKKKCCHRSFSLRDSFCQYSETHLNCAYPCFSSSGRPSFQTNFTVLSIQISSTTSPDISLTGNIVPLPLNGYCGSNLKSCLAFSRYFSWKCVEKAWYMWMPLT